MGNLKSLRTSDRDILLSYTNRHLSQKTWKKEKTENTRPFPTTHFPLNHTPAVCHLAFDLPPQLPASFDSYCITTTTFIRLLDSLSTSIRYLQSQYSTTRRACAVELAGLTAYNSCITRVVGSDQNSVTMLLSLRNISKATGTAKSIATDIEPGRGESGLA